VVDSHHFENEKSLFTLLLHQFNGFFQDNLVKLAPESKPFWVLMKQEMIGYTHTHNHFMALWILSRKPG